MREVCTAGRYFKGKFGQKVYKIPVSIPGFTCPNIDGTVARGGCIFCENESFSPNFDKPRAIKRFSLNLQSTSNPILDVQLLALEAQVVRTKAKLAKKFGAKKFLVYFQSFTNTYAPLQTLKALYEKALTFPDVIGLSIGTRTDSVAQETLAYLAELSKTKEIWVEYGIQSVDDGVLAHINRGHDVESMFRQIAATKALGLNVCAHLIFGLPKETKKMMLHSVQRVVDAGVDAVKMHPMYVVKNTAMTQMYHKGEFVPITQEAYLSVLKEAFLLLPAHIMVQRVSAGIDDESLIAPQWCRIKHEQMAQIKKMLYEIGLIY